MTAYSLRTLALAFLSLTVAGCGGVQEGGGSGDGPVPAGPRSVTGGVYTPSQAIQGETVFDIYCTACHSAFDLLSPNFASRWSGRSLQELYLRIKNTMPENDPGVLTEDQTVNVIAYMLSRQGFRAGDIPLPREPTALGAITIEATGGP